MVVNYSPSAGEVETESLARRAPNLIRDPASKTNVEKKKIANDDLWTSGAPHGHTQTCRFTYTHMKGAGLKHTETRIILEIGMSQECPLYCVHGQLI